MMSASNSESFPHSSPSRKINSGVKISLCVSLGSTTLSDAPVSVSPSVEERCTADCNMLVEKKKKVDVTDELLLKFI